MVRFVLGFVCSIAVAGCSTTTIVLPSSCAEHDAKCQRNLNAQTLSQIGQEEAALKLMCMDPDLIDVMGESCKQ